MFAFALRDGTHIAVPLCVPCMNEAFSPDSWAKLQGRDPSTPGRVGEWSDPCFDGEFRFTLVNLESQLQPSRERGPILRLRRPARDIVESSTLCGICRVVSELDTRRYLQSGDSDMAALIDLQLYYPEKCSGVRLPMLLGVKLELEMEHKHKPRKNIKFRNRALLAVIHEEEDERDEHVQPAGSTTPEATGTSSGIDQSPNTGENARTSSVINEVLSEARRWMQGCDASHLECQLSFEPRLPMRALHIRAHEDTYTVKLIECGESGMQGRYAALSYVWGVRPTKRLVHDTIEGFMSGIPFEDLPNTMRDAVRVTQALGISYLWIDALCIMQDDDTDKELQIPYMNEYYRNAAVVISASGASDAHMGFLSWQPSERNIYARLDDQTVTVDPDLGPISYRIPLHFGGGVISVRLDVEPPLYNHSKEPINQRGWTLQESRLARRLLIFPATGGVIARCLKGEQSMGQVLGDPFHEREGTTLIGYDDLSGHADDDDDDSDETHEDPQNENGGEGKDNGDQQNQQISVRSAENARASESIEGEDSRAAEEEVMNAADPTHADDEASTEASTEAPMAPDIETEMAEVSLVEDTGENEDKRKQREQAAEVENAFRDWMTTIQDYSRRSLSQPGDILVAIGALAQDFHEQQRPLLGAYAAGLWVGALRQGLLWHTSIQSRRRLAQVEDTGTRPRGASMPYLAPSWSWAACAKPVTFRTFVETDVLQRTGPQRGGTKPEEPRWHIEILSCETSLKSGTNPYGAVLGGYVDIRGTLLPVRCGAQYNRRRHRGDDIGLVVGDKHVFCLAELIVADSTETLALIDDACCWLPIFYATRGRLRGLIVRRQADGTLQRLGFAEFLHVLDTDLDQKQTLRLV